MSGQIPKTVFRDFKVLQHNIFTQKSSKFCKKQGKLSKLCRTKPKKNLHKILLNPFISLPVFKAIKQAKLN